MNILVLNVGSSSVKYDIFKREKQLFGGEIDKIGKKVKTHKQAIKIILNELKKRNIKIKAIGHRFVHGGTIEDSKIINNDLLRKLRKVADLAPLHNFPELKGIKICQDLFKGIKNVVVFDTSFHRTIPEKADVYGIPYKLANKFGIRCYGFHGTNHKYVALEASKILKKKKLNLITCHLGSGCSVTAVKNSKSIDTSMGFTPLEGLVMCTRCGDLDPAIIFYLMKHGHYNYKKIGEILNEKSGLLGISGISKDMRVLLKSKKKRAALAKEVFCYRAKKYIGAYTAVLGKVDAIVFTAGIGQNSWWIRKKILNGFNDIRLDNEANKKNKVLITKKSSKIKVLVIKANEELMIAREVLRLVK